VGEPLILILATIAIGVGLVALSAALSDRRDRDLHGAHAVRTQLRGETPCRCAACTRHRIRHGGWPR
jgi:hypothetical protein